MNRREFITLLRGVTAWPVVARAQQPAMRRVAVLMTIREGDPEEQGRLRALREGLERLGWAVGRNLHVDVRYAVGGAERAREIAAELATHAPDVIVSTGSVATAAIKQATTTIPVVFTHVNEPVTQGFVSSLARPGGNITGFTLIDFSVIGKAVEMLATMAPALSRIGLMFNSDTYPLYNSYLQMFQSDPRTPAKVVSAAARSPAEIDATIATLAAQPGSGLAVVPDGGFTLSNRAPILAALHRHRMPAVVFYRQFVAEGALMSYGPDSIDLNRRAADYVDRILKGAKPADLPVQQPTKFELVINLKAAKAIGLEVPDKLLALADGVIE
jgi:putative tryptophan/tyrosine transport system substrate-binding protein